MTPTPPIRRALRPVLLPVVLAIVLLAAGCGDDDGDTVDTGTTTETTVATSVAPTTTAAPPTTAVPTTTVLSPADAEAACVAGDQLACDTLGDQRLRELCDGGRGSVDACQVLLAREGDGIPDGPNGESAGDPEQD